jgi:hypothetical protein
MSAWGDKNKSGGGGFLNNVWSKIVGYKFTNDFPSENAKADEDTKLYMTLTVREDGAEEDTETTLHGGGGEYFEISEDGQTITSVDEDRVPKLWAESGIFKFIDSLVDADFPEARLGNTEETKKLNFSGIVGTRIYTEQKAVVVDGKPLKRKVKKGKFAGKEFAVTNLVVSKIGELPVVKAASAAKSAVKKATNGSGKVLPSAAPEVDYAAADEFLTNLLADAKDNTLEMKAISLAVTRRGTKLKLAEEVREPIRLTLIDPAYLAAAATRGVIAIDGTSVSLA